MKPAICKNQTLWNQLSKEGVVCSRPWLDLTSVEAEKYINKNGFYEFNLKSKKVLCLASGGGQQSIAFALLGADVTVVDFSDEQLAKDRHAAQKCGRSIRIVQSDMRDLSFCNDDEFDVVFQPYSINYIPAVDQVFNEVSRVLKVNGLYDLMLHNPYAHGSWKDGCWGNQWEVKELWKEIGYPIWQHYKDGHPIQTADPHWNFTNADNKEIRIKSPQEYRHTLSTIVNELLGRGMELIRLEEENATDYDSLPGTWEHYKSCLPPWLYLLCKKN